jgi:hypothetical protein
MQSELILIKLVILLILTVEQANRNYYVGTQIKAFTQSFETVRFVRMRRAILFECRDVRQFFEGEDVMMSRRFQQLRTALMAVACIAMAGSPAWATSGQCNKSCSCYCQGIDSHGCLSNCGGRSCTFCCVINTRTCKYSGSCRCKIKNCCRKSECYKNVCFCQVPSYCCTSSCYSCDSCGNCCYTACGCCSNGGEGIPS